MEGNAKRKLNEIANLLGLSPEETLQKMQEAVADLLNNPDRVKPEDRPAFKQLQAAYKRALH